MFWQRLSYVLGSFSLASLAYVYYIKRCYRYLKSLGFDGPPPKFFIGNLAEFASKENSSQSSKALSHYSKTLQRWTKTYGKIYGYYEGHSPVIVLADVDLVTEVFVNQTKLLSHRRSFPMSKNSSDPNSDIFLNNGLRWIRVRYGLEKVMFNNKNTAKSLEYFDKSFINTFTRQNLGSSEKQINIQNHIRLLMVQAMVSVMFGTNINTFSAQSISRNMNKKSQILTSTDNNNNTDDEDDESLTDLTFTKLVSDKFTVAFESFENFSLLKFFSLVFSEFGVIWRGCENFKHIFNRNICNVSYFADPMDWFYANFINRHLLLFTLENQNHQNAEKSSESALKYSISENDNHIFYNTSRLSTSSRLASHSNYTREAQTTEIKPGYLNSFLHLTYKPIIKFNQIETSNRKINHLKQEARRRAFTTTEKHIPVNTGSESRSSHRTHSLSSMINSSKKSSRTRHLSTGHFSAKKETQLSTLSLFSNEVDSEDFENWKLTINEALSNTLLMFFAGYETTSSAISFCCHVISSIKEEREKLIDEINQYWKELSVNLDKFNIKPIDLTKKNGFDSDAEDSSSIDSQIGNDSLTDDVFEEDTTTKRSSGLDQWNDLYETLEKMRYLDMFVKEVLRMFPIASSMVSRKCVSHNLTLDGGNYKIPYGMNIVVDVLTIHYDPVLWGPTDPKIFYPERFLTERNPAAWLPFGIGCRKCLGIKLAMSQIKLFIVRLLQNYKIDKPNSSEINPKNIYDSTETKDVLFCSPLNGVNVVLENKY